MFSSANKRYLLQFIRTIEICWKTRSHFAQTVQNVVAWVWRKWPRCTLFSRRVRKSFNGSNINNQSADIGKPQSGPCLALVHLFLSSSYSLSFLSWSSATSVCRTWPPKVIFVTILLLFEIHALPKAWAKDTMNQNLAKSLFCWFLANTHLKRST